MSTDGELIGVPVLAAFTTADGGFARSFPRAWGHVRAVRVEPAASPTGQEIAPTLLGAARGPATAMAFARVDAEANLRDALRLAAEGSDAVCAFDTCTHLSEDGPEPAGSVWRIALVRCRPGLSRAEYGHHWRERHVPLVLSRGPLFTAYRTSVVIEGSVPWDGMVEQLFASVAAAAEHDRRNQHEKADVRADIASMIVAAENYLVLRS